MKHIKLLLIISTVLIISSCKNEKKEDTNKNKINTITPTDTLIKQNVKAIDTISVFVKNDSISLAKKELEKDSVKNKKNKAGDELKVVIDGEIYYKLYKGDKPVKNHNSLYYSEEINRYYDIITGKPEFKYGKHGKVIKEK
jgi:hypothetical protein